LPSSAPATGERRRPGAVAAVRRSFGRIPIGYRLMIPLLGLLGLIVAYPIGYSLWLSFTDYSILRQGETSFVGLDQYIGLPGNATYMVALRNTLVFVAVAVTLELTMGLALALALQRQRWMRNVTRSLLLVPMFVTPIAVGLMFRFLLNEQLGAIPAILDRFGISIDFFGPHLALLTIIAIDVWQWTPFMLLLLLAGLESLPTQPFEAARVDGASAWLTFRRVTLPLLRPVIAVAVLIRMLDAFKIFEYVFATTRGGPGAATETIQYQVYRTGFQFFRLGEAAAMAFVLVVIVLGVIMVLYRRLTAEVGV
jgi:multiple sugar transport system permease protein